MFVCLLSDKDSNIILSRICKAKSSVNRNDISTNIYLEKSIRKFYKKCITKIRVSSHNLCIESGRHKHNPRDKRICKTCTSTIKDEYHEKILLG